MTTQSVCYSTLLRVLAGGLVAALATCAVHAGTPGYTRVDVKGRVELEIANDWTINDAESRTRVADFGSQLVMQPGGHIASLSAQSYPAPAHALVRVSFIPMDPPLSQIDVRREVEADRIGILQGLADVWADESPAMWKGLAQIGSKPVGAPSFAVEPLGHQLAFVIRYRRSSINNSAEVFQVEQYHVPLGSEKALITMSYVVGDPAARTARDKLKGSFVIR